jgi:hypothetical protein
MLREGLGFIRDSVRFVLVFLSSKGQTKLESPSYEWADIFGDLLTEAWTATGGAFGKTVWPILPMHGHLSMRLTIR